MSFRQLLGGVGPRGPPPGEPAGRRSPVREGSTSGRQRGRSGESLGMAPAGAWEPRRQDLSWLVRLRWLALLSVTGVVALARALGVIDGALALMLITAGLAVANVVWQLSLMGPGDEADEPSPHHMLLAQLSFDYLALTLLLHYAGGASNPFGIFFVFHAALGAVMLPRLSAWLVPGLAVWLHSCVVVAEMRGLLPHTPLHLGNLADQPAPIYTLGYLVALWAAIGGVVLFVRTVRVRQEQAEALRRSRERVARSRERLARVGEIAAGVAHSVRNPLHGALNCAELLQGATRGGGAAVADTIDMLTDSLGRIERVTHRLLSLTRERPLARRATEVADLLHDAVGFATTRARERDVHFDLQVDDDVTSALLDPDLMLEVLINVLDNAVDASPRGGSVRVHALTDRGSTLVIEVSDEGSGLSPEVLDHAFDPFFTTKPIGEGTGIGLALGKRVVTDHQGTITLECVAGGGAMVRISLPARESHSPGDGTES